MTNQNQSIQTKELHKILQEINESNSSNYKLSVLKKYVSNELLQRVLKMTYDTVAFTYGISTKNIQDASDSEDSCTLEEALDELEFKFCTREYTGNKALFHLSNMIAGLSEEDGILIQRILNRDLKLNVGTTQINKVWKGLIETVPYMRCDTYSAKTSSNISFPAIVQLKSDGTYREFTVQDGHVSSRSRSGESYEYPILFDLLKTFPDGVYTGELTVIATEESMQSIFQKYEHALKKNKDVEELEHIISEFKKHENNGSKYVLPRGIGNGLINSDNPPHNDIVLEVWDYITLDEYNHARLRDKKNPNKTPYESRFKKLQSMMATRETKNISVIPYYYVDNLKEALEITSKWMTAGYEGSILKDLSGVFKDGTSKHQLKLKLEIDCEMRIVDFLPGNKGSKNEKYFSAITFINDDETIKGQIGVTTMSEMTRDWIFENMESLKGKIMSVKFNDLSKGTSNAHYSLSHPRFIEIRDDKTETDSLEKVLELREMAMTLSK